MEKELSKKCVQMFFILCVAALSNGRISDGDCFLLANFLYETTCKRALNTLNRMTARAISSEICAGWPTLTIYLIWNTCWKAWSLQLTIKNSNSVLKLFFKNMLVGTGILISKLQFSKRARYQLSHAGPPMQVIVLETKKQTGAKNGELSSL